MFGWIVPLSYTVLDFYLLQKNFFIIITDSISLLVMSFQLSLSSWFSLRKFNAYRNLSISSSLSNMLAYNCWQCYLVIIYLCFISYNFFYFIIYFGHFLNKAGLTVNNLSLIKKKTALEDFHIFYFCLISDWFPPWFSLVPSFCWCWVLFIPLFLIPLEGRLTFCFHFSLFLEVGHCKLIAYNCFCCHSPWRRKWQLVPVFLPGEFHGQWSQQATVLGVTKNQPHLSNWAHRFLKVVNFFQFFSRYILTSSLISLLIHWFWVASYIVSICLSFTIFHPMIDF